ncbi:MULTISPECIES: condensation domain-containing protein [Streptosporangium]|uniref:Condensation domain-containing protein n=1 Tax=Streptosporangium brasiliense TaxID=47480 RepID=A0ABT9RLW6_9ACTN|nr:condensation domain-containing protein [Streptosporangium brasiliense]MDP9870281.1 hypothetical protein [Streptosporangium brasiliense]
MTDTLPLASPPTGGEDRIPLSFQQEFLRMMDHGDGAGPYGPRYTIVGGWRITGELDLDSLRGALYDVVARHEALRTSVVLDDGEPYQRIFPPAWPDLLIHDLADRDRGDRDVVAEQFLNEIEAGEFGADEMPLMRGVLGRFDRRDAVFVFMAHHTAVDGWSAQIVMRDLAACYAARREHRAPDLPEVRQHREYVAWQHANTAAPAIVAAREFWRENLRGAQVVPIPTDRPREEGPFVTGWHRFLLEEEFRASAAALAAETRSSPFMVLLAAYLTYLREQTGQTDLVVPTFTPGRHPSWVQDTVGSFYNLLPLRTDISGCTSFREVIAKVRATCIATYTHEIPFLQLIEEAPDLMASVMEPNSAACVFQVVQSPFMMGGAQVGDLRFTAMRRRVLSAPVGSQLPDGALWTLELQPEGDIVGKIGFTSNLFDESTVTAMVSDFRRVLRETVTGPGR